MGLKETEFRSCFEGGKYAKKVQAEVDQAENLDIIITPTFVLAKTEPGGKIEGSKLLGYLPFGRLQRLVEDHLHEGP